MKNGIFDTCDREVLGLILQIPLAETARPEGQPHLTPEFSFIWPSFDPSDGLPNTAVDEDTTELANNWKKFFHSYTKLRIEKNNGKNFKEASYIYYAAISSICQDQFFHEPSSEFKKCCIMHSLDIVQADIICALEYFNEFYYPVLHFLLFSDHSLDTETDALTAEEILTFTNVQLSLVCHLIEKEGWYDLACSMFSFYLILAIIASNGNLDAIENLPKVIKSLSGLPRFEYVSRAIDFACSVALENGRSTTFARLDQFRQSIDEEIKSSIAGGETQLCEFKSTLRRNLHTGQDDHKIEHSVLKTIAGFLNKEGGRLLIGVSDDRDITGIEADGFESFDKWQLHFKNLVNQALPSAMDFIECKVHTMDDKTVSVINCNRSLKPVYYRNRVTKQEEFYVRRGNATDNLAMSDAFEYIKYHFQS